MTLNQQLSTQPYKGSRDFFPEDMQIRNYIFDKWRKVCRRYGYEEYDGPFLESFDIYAAKSGEELVNQQIYSFTDRGDRKVAIRPEMTPTLARMVAQKFNDLPRPIRWFSIPNLWRYERPQKGRLREHYQLNVDMFGIESATADFEIISLACGIMSEFGATQKMFQIRVGNRRLIEDVMASLGLNEEQRFRTGKILDRKNKVNEDEFNALLTEDAKLTATQLKGFIAFLNNPAKAIEKIKDTSKGAKEVNDLLSLFKQTDFKDIVKYDPTIMRGFDYYTGNVFEQYDLNPENNRAMYGGGRYDDLVEMFIGKKLTGIGFGMGDVTFKLFLENWGLLPKLPSESDFLVTLWPTDSSKYLQKSFEVANILRTKNKNVQVWLEENSKLDKQLKYADKKGIRYAIIIGENEIKRKEVTVKDLVNNNQNTITFESFFSSLQ